MKMIELTLDDGNPVAIRPSSISYIARAAAGTVVAWGRTTTGQFVHERYEEVKDQLAGSFITIALTKANGDPLSINAAAVAYVQAADDGAYIAFDAGGSIETRESYEAVMAAIGAPIAAVVE